MERFFVGMTYLNKCDFARARAEFNEGRKEFGGQFPVHFAYGWSSRTLGDLRESYEGFEAALSQATNNREASLASLFLGRLAFDEKKYDQAYSRFERAYLDDPTSLSALAEAAASVLLNPSQPDPKIGEKVRDRINRFAKEKPEGFAPDTHIRLWYLLALSLAPLAPAAAVEAFQKGSQGDLRTQRKDRKARDAVVELLWELNSRSAPILLQLISASFPWI